MVEVVSPAICTCACAIGPQEYEVSPYWMHSSRVDPAVEMGVSASDPSAEGRRRRPTEPVSTNTLSTVVQFWVLGWHTVILVNTPLTNPPFCPSGPNPTVTVAVLFTAGLVVDEPEADLVP